MFGRIVYVHPGGGPFGFIEAEDKTRAYFNAADLIDIVLDQSLRGRRVEFDLTDNGRGPAAVNIRPVEVNHE